LAGYSVYRSDMPTKILPGRPYPLGATWDGAGTNFSIYSQHAECVDLCLFDQPTAPETARIRLPERCANLCFGGAKRNRLFMAASRSLYSLYVNTQGAPGG